MTDISLTNYSYTSPRGYEGTPAGSIVNFDLRGTLEGFINGDTSPLPFGRVVATRADGKQGLPTKLDQTVVGVSLALAHYEASSQFEGNAGTPYNYPLTVAKKAILFMLAETNITKGVDIYFRCISKATPGANDALGRIRNDADALDVTNVALTSNVATITVAAHGLAVGQVVTIAGLTETALNGTHTITTVPTANTFTFALTNANISSAADTGTIDRADLITGIKLLEDAVAGSLVRVEVDL